MSPKKFVSNNSTLADRASEEDRDCVDKQGQDHYDDQYTKHRPPYFNDENFSSTQPTGSNAEPSQLDTLPETINDSMHVTNNTFGNHIYEQYVPSTVHTDSMMRAGGSFILRPDLAYYINRDYQWHGGSVQPLTSQAIAALDSNQTQLYGDNLHNWQPPQVGHNSHADLHNDWSTSYLAPAEPTSQTPTTNSWVFPPEPGDHSTDIIRNVGDWSDIQAAPNTAWARQIRDEDTRDTQ
ncbi:hypothetical protein F5Y06DRAFT_173055 [Hypoxylon sp. FL0890]|nr:hypothetical protein F5Y06DRAFT_173055 [Hypoxylon sp. FL0890]